MSLKNETFFVLITENSLKKSFEKHSVFIHLCKSKHMAEYCIMNDIVTDI